MLSRLCNPSERGDLGSCTRDIILLGHLHRELDDDWAWGWARDDAAGVTTNCVPTLPRASQIQTLNVSNFGRDLSFCNALEAIYTIVSMSDVLCVSIHNDAFESLLSLIPPKYYLVKEGDADTGKSLRREHVSLSRQPLDESRSPANTRNIAGIEKHSSRWSGRRPKRPDAKRYLGAIFLASFTAGVDAEQCR